MSHGDDSFVPSDPELKPDASDVGSFEPELKGPSGAPTNQSASTSIKAYTVFGPRLGQGGQGEVLRAVQLRLSRVVALKRVHSRIMGPSLGTVEVNRRKLSFIQEALITACLDHPNIVPIHDMGTDDQGHPFLAMKLVHGTLWSDIIIADRKMEPADFFAKHLSILVTVSQAVAFAHSRGIVHCDLHPGQVMVGSYGEVYLTDWGLALLFDAGRLKNMIREEALGDAVVEALLDCERAPSPDRARGPAGSPGYLAPEQAKRSAAGVGPWTDVYLLGGILYYLLTDSVPHPEVTREFLEGGADIPPVKLIHDRVKPGSVPAELVSLCQAALQMASSSRPGASDFIHGLRDYLTGAGRRRESLAISEAAVASMSHSSSRSYGTWSDLDKELRRALDLWNGNQKAHDLRMRVLVEHASLALQNNDLLLAESLLKGLKKEDEPSRRLRQKIASARQNAQRHRRQRVVALRVTALLVLATAITAWLLVTAQAERDVTKRINGQVASEARLAEDAALTVKLPREVDQSILSEPAEVAVKDAYKKLLDRMRKLRDQREALEAESRLPLPPPPASLGWREGLILLELQDDDSQQELVKAKELFTEYLLDEEYNGVARIGLAVVALREGEFEEGTRYLEEAESIFRKDSLSSEQYISLIHLMVSAHRLRVNVTGNQFEVWSELQKVLETEWMNSGVELAEYYDYTQKFGALSNVTDGLANALSPGVFANGMKRLPSESVEGRVASARRLDTKAMSRFRSAIENFPQDGRRLDLAFIKAQMAEEIAITAQSIDELREAECESQEAVEIAAAELSADDWQMGYLKGIHAFVLGQSGKAEECILVSLDALSILEGKNLNGHYGRVLLGAANAMFEVGWYSECIGLLQAPLNTWLSGAQQFDPKSMIPNMVTLGKARRESGDILGAKGDFETAYGIALQSGESCIAELNLATIELSSVLQNLLQDQQNVEIVTATLMKNSEYNWIQLDRYWRHLISLHFSYAVLGNTEEMMAIEWELIESCRAMLPPDTEHLVMSYALAARFHDSIGRKDVGYQLRLEGMMRALKLDYESSPGRIYMISLAEPLSNRARAGWKRDAAVALKQMSIAETLRWAPDYATSPMVGSYLLMKTVNRPERERAEVISIVRTLREMCKQEASWSPMHNSMWIRGEGELAVALRNSTDPLERRVAGLLAARALAGKYTFGPLGNNGQVDGLIKLLEEIVKESGTESFVQPFDESVLKDTTINAWLDGITGGGEIEQVLAAYPAWSPSDIPTPDVYRPIIFKFVQDEYNRLGPAQIPETISILPWKKGQKESLLAGRSLSATIEE